jgi:hypothetical protein
MLVMGHLRHVIGSPAVLHFVCVPSVWVEDFGVVPTRLLLVGCFNGMLPSSVGTNQILGFM